MKLKYKEGEVTANRILGVLTLVAGLAPVCLSKIFCLYLMYDDVTVKYLFNSRC